MSSRGSAFRRALGASSSCKASHPTLAFTQRPCEKRALASTACRDRRVGALESNCGAGYQVHAESARFLAPAFPHEATWFDTQPPGRCWTALRARECRPLVELRTTIGIVPHLRHAKEAEEAARFYGTVFPNDMSIGYSVTRGLARRPGARLCCRVHAARPTVHGREPHRPYPPATAILCPVTYDARLEARKTAA